MTKVRGTPGQTPCEALVCSRDENTSPSAFPVVLVPKGFTRHPVSLKVLGLSCSAAVPCRGSWAPPRHRPPPPHSRRSLRSEEHTFELPSPQYLVCRLLSVKKTPTSLA